MASLDELVSGYDDYYRKAERIEIDPKRFEKGIDRGDDGACGVGALVTHEGRGLFVRESETWLLPGGRLDAGETFESGARRELREETGLEIEIVDLGAVAEQTFVRRGSEESYEFSFITFIARPTDPNPELPARSEAPAIDEVAWFSSVPENAFDRDLLERLFETYI